MPLPLLLAAAVPTAKVIVTTYAYASGATIFGAAAGGSGTTAAGIGGWWWWRTPNPTTPAVEHVDILNGQQKATEQRIGEVDAHQEERDKTANASRKEMDDKLTETVESEKILDKSATVLAKKTDELGTVVTTAASASQSLSHAMPSLKKASSNIHGASKKTVSELTKLSKRLDAAVAEKKPLLDIIEKQDGEIKILSQKNQELKTELGSAHRCLSIFVNRAEAPGAQNSGPTTNANNTPPLR